MGEHFILLFNQFTQWAIVLLESTCQGGVTLGRTYVTDARYS